LNAPSQDIKDLLEASSSGTGLTFGTNLFVSQEPDGGGVVDKVVSIFDTGGGEPDTNRTLKTPTVMVRVRGNRFGYQEGYTLAELILDTLHAVKNTTVNSTRYVYIIAQSDIIFLDYDKNNRPSWSINFRIMRTS
jgi:hypothetical protein